MRKVVVFSFDEAYEAYVSVPEPFEMFCIDQDSMQVMQSKTLSDAKEFYDLKDSVRGLQKALDKCRSTPFLIDHSGDDMDTSKKTFPWVHASAVIDHNGIPSYIPIKGMFQHGKPDDSDMTDALKYLAAGLNPPDPGPIPMIGLDAMLRADAGDKHEDDDFDCGDDMDEDDLDLQLDGEEEDGNIGIGDSDWDKEDGTTQPRENIVDSYINILEQRRKEGRCPQCGELGAFVGLRPTCSKHGPY
jgi:hypothetical protein